MILNIRGTSGSGKSTLMRKVIEEFGLAPAPQPDEHLARYGSSKRGKKFGYWSGTPVTKLTSSGDLYGLAVVGDYSNDCGGCDGITTKGVAQDDIQDRVRYFRGNLTSHLPINHVLFEGLLITHIYGRYRDMAREFPGEFKFVFLDTPLEVCRARVDSRRAQQGKAPLSDHYNTDKMYNDMLRVEGKVKADGLPYVWLDHTRAFEHLKEILGL